MRENDKITKIYNYNMMAVTTAQNCHKNEFMFNAILTLLRIRFSENFTTKQTHTMVILCISIASYNQNSQNTLKT